MDMIVLQTFLTAASTGSFTATAQQLNASPSSVTERIKQLEYRLGAKLFDRDKRGCRLTAAGTRFVSSAQQSVRAWELAKQNIGLPQEFKRSISLGGQYFFWDNLMMDWLPRLREALPDLAMRLTAGASARLNRDLAEGFLDLAVLYDPIFHRSVRSEPIYTDQLILVTGGAAETWQDDYVRIEWGQSLGDAIDARLESLPQTGLVLDLGVRSAQVLIDQKMSGYLPAKAARHYIDAQQLLTISDTPQFEFPAYVSWRRDLDPDLAEQIIAMIKQEIGKG